MTVTTLAILPAACAFQYHGFEPTIDQTRFIAHFNGLQDGSHTVIRFDDIEGLISVPSFHVAGASMVTWALRRCRVLFYPIALVNAALVTATFMTGSHYLVDCIVMAVLFAASVRLYRAWGVRLLRAASDGGATAARSRDGLPSPTPRGGLSRHPAELPD